MDDEPQSDAEVLRRGVRALVVRLPHGWTSLDSGLANERTDALVGVTSPDGRSASLAFEAKRTVDGRDLEPLMRRFARRQESSESGIATCIVASRYLSPPVRQRMIELGISFVDATGNVHVEVSDPGLFISDRGADGDPWRGKGRPRGTLKGAPAAKVVRALADFDRSWTARQLIDVAQVSTGAVYRIVDYLDREGLLEREVNGQFRVVDWPRLLRRWSDDYGFVRSSVVTRWLAPRGLVNLRERAASVSAVEYVATGTIAAERWAPYAPTRLAMIYTSDAMGAASNWDLRPAEAGANVMLAEPESDVVFARTLSAADGLRIVGPSQAVVDLMTGPGRNPSEAEELLGWMKRHESEWRREA